MRQKPPATRFTHLIVYVSAIFILAIGFFSLTAAWEAPFTTNSAAAQEQQVPSFNKSFNPSTIGPGSVSTLAFEIANDDPANPVTDLAFMDTLPQGVVIASPANTTSTCTGGTLDAPEGGSTITFSGGELGTGGSCTITVDVTSSAAGTHTNITGDLTSSAGNSGNATADLTVATNRPGFSKSFSPTTVTLGSRSTLTFTIDNTANTSNVTSLSFTDNLPAGMEVADPANASNTCTTDFFTGGVLTADPGTSVVSLGFGGGLDIAAVDAGSSCTVAVDVLATGVGSLNNVSGELTSIAGSSGKASASLDVTRGTLALIKSFTDDPVPPDGTATLEFTLTNFDRSNTATNIAFDDDLAAVLSGLAAAGTPLTDPCGAGSRLSGTSILSLTGGSLVGGGSCTFSVTLQVPADAAPGIYPNTTSSVTADIGGTPFTGDPAGDKLFIAPTPSLTKSFTDDPVTAGDTVTLEFTITNGSSTSSATDITFTDEFAVVLPTASSVPADGFCGAGSTATFTPLGTFNPPNLEISGASLDPGASCTFSITLDVAPDAPTGIYPNTTSDITATVDNETVTGEPATDDLSIVTAPDLVKNFSDDPVVPGDSVTLAFTLIHDENAPTDATGISFTDDLGAVLPGLTATGLPVNDICGQGSELDGTTFLSFTGGSLSPTESCTFSVTLQVPADTFPGAYGNTTSDVSATVQGLAVTQQPGSDTLDVVSVLFDKSFTKNPVVPGETVPLSFTLRNISPVSSTTDIAFSDNLDAALSGLAAVDTPQNDICGTGSSITGTDTLIFSGGNLAPGASCTFAVITQVPANASPGFYGNVTSQATANFDGTPITVDPAAAPLNVIEALSLSKTFTDDPVVSGGTATLEFTISNASPVSTTTSIAFTDDLDAALSGLAAVPPLPTEPCGAGSSLTGTSTLSFSGGSLAPGASCTFSVTLQVPSGVPFGSTATNTTSQVTGLLDGVPITGDPATDDLQIDTFLFTKAFDGLTTATGAPTLIFTIENLNASAGTSGLSFSDDLDAALPGLTAMGLPADDVCGAGSQLSGTSTLTLTGGNLSPGSSCTFGVTLQVPITATAGTYTNTTSDLAETGIAVSSPASDTLTVEPPPAFSKSFVPDFIGVGQPSTLIFQIDNTASALAASSLDFTDNLPSGVVVDDPPNASTTCTGGTLTATAGSGTISYGGGTVSAGASCSLQISVTGTSAGTHVNTTGELTSSSGSSGTAADTLTVNPQPDFSKSFAPNPILVGETSTLSLVIDNTGSTVDATSLDFTDNLPSGVVIASPANASTSCTGGTLTASAGTSIITYSGGTVSAGASCSVSVDVTSSAAGTYDNTTGNLTSSLGASGTTSATLTVDPIADLSLFKSDSPDPVLAGRALTYTLTISNSGPSQADGVVVTDTTPAAFSPLGNTCGASGFPLVWNVGALPAGEGASCTINGTVDVGLSATITNTASVSSNAFDPQPTNNVYTETTLVLDNHFSVDDVSQAEGNSGSTQFSFTISRTDNRAASSVDYQTADGTATSGSDYSAVTATTVQFPAGGALAQTVVVEVTGDTRVEADETFTVNLSNPTNGDLADSQGTGTIQNDDAASLSISDVEVNEGAGTATFTVTLSTLSDFDVTASYTTSDGTATAGSDYTAASGTVSIPAGSTAAAIDVGITDDALDEADETFMITLSSPTGASIDDGTGVATILDDDTPVDLSLTKSVSDDPALSGATLVYRLTASNPGPYDASGVVVTDTLPSPLSFDSASASCAETNGSVVCSVGTLAADASATLIISATVPVNFTGVITNSASLSASEPDPDPGNNTASTTSQVEETATVVDDDFEDGVGPGWCQTDLTSAPNGEGFLGEFSNGTKCLELEDLPNHTNVLVRFNLYIIRSWDGNQVEDPGRFSPTGGSGETIGPDRWQFAADGSTLLDTTFSNWSAFNQAYPGNYPEGDYPAQTGAVSVDDLGYDFEENEQDAVYQLTFIFPHTAPTLTLEFIAFGLQEITDESWGLDNVLVKLDAGAAGQFRLYLPIVVR